VPSPTVSVALCTHNGEKFIVEQLRSILEQSAQPREIVVSDDASTDGTLNRIQDTFDDYRARHAECTVDLTILRNLEPLGVAKNFEQAILACTSDLVALCDQDDVWAVDRLRRASDLFESRPDLLLLHSDARLIDEAGGVIPGTLFEALEVSGAAIRAIHAGEAFEQLLRRNLVTGATVMLRRALATLAVPFPEAWVHDEWLAIVASGIGCIDVIEDALIDYRQHGTNQIGVEKLSLTDKYRRMVEPGALRNRRLLARASALENRFASMGASVGEGRIEAVRQKLAHEMVRSKLSPLRVARILPILRELGTGRYGEFGRGVSDACRDLIQPLKAAR
jgi:glycosyltransferase involved in cell wall biosynthesis